MSLNSQTSLHTHEHVEDDKYSRAEEIAHTVSHGVGMVLAMIATVFMVAEVARTGSGAALAATAVYCVSMTILFAASTLYHGAYGSTFQPFFNLLDHSAIYVKIAGSYTPFAVISLPPETGVPLLVFVWVLAAIGVIMKIVGYMLGIGDKFRKLSLGIYLGMGWSGIILIGDIIQSLPDYGSWWLVGGGLAYTVGAIFYAIKTIPLGHFIWHMFVLVGSACHAMTIYYYVLPQAVI